MKRLPNVLVLGTPGVGKTTFGDALKRLLEGAGFFGFERVEISRVIKEHQSLRSSRKDNVRDCSIFREGRVLEYLRKQYIFKKSRGGVIIDFHSASVIRPNWFDLIVVLRAKTETIFDRLVRRKYSEKKVQENIECEIFGVVQEELENLMHDGGYDDGGYDDGGHGNDFRRRPDVMILDNDSDIDLSENLYKVFMSLNRAHLL